MCHFFGVSQFLLIFFAFFLNLSYVCLVFIVILVNRNSYFKQRSISSNLCYCSKSLKSLPVYVYFVKLTEKRNVSLSYFRQTSTLPELTNQTPVNVRKWFVLTSSFFNLFITGGFPCPFCRVFKSVWKKQSGNFIGAVGMHRSLFHWR